MEYLHIFVLCAFAVSHPLLEILAGGPEFFVVRGSARKDVVAMLLLLFAGLPAVLCAVLGVSSLISRRLRVLVRWIFTAVLAALILMPAMGRLSLWPPYAVLASGCTAGLACAFLLSRYAGARMFVACMSPILVVSPLLFLRNGGISSFLFPETEHASIGAADTETPLVMLLFDEFSLHSLLDENFKVDEKRFPNFAALAKESWWFRNATAVNQFTPIAVPAILSGRYPNPEKLLPTVRNYPGNIFTMLQRSHEFVVYEPITRLCPDEVCKAGIPKPRFRERMPFLFADLSAVYIDYVIPRNLDVGAPETEGKWLDFWNDEKDDWKKAEFERPRRVAEFEAQIKKIRATEKPLFFFVHAILPHMPYQFAPSGKTYSMRGPRHGYVNNRWDGDEVATYHGFQRYLLQLANCDKLLGKVINRLKEHGLYDKALIYVGSDHGVSFQAGTYRRGNPGHESFYEDILSVPLFIKKPFQREPVESDLNVQTIDILPTIADGLEISVPWRIDGISVFDASSERPGKKRMMLGNLPVSGVDGPPSAALGKPGEFMEFPAPQIPPRKSLEWKFSLPGCRQFNPEDRFFIGPHAEYVGKSVNAQDVSGGAVQKPVKWYESIETENGARFIKVNQKSYYVPVRITGTIDSEKHLELALAIDGVLRGFTFTSNARDPSRKDFEFLVSEASFHDGRNVIELFIVEEEREGKVSLMEITDQQKSG